MGRVEILPARDFAWRRATTPASFALRFPTAWRPEHRINPHAAEVERETIAWLARYGIGLDADEAERLAKFNCAMYGGYSLPGAGPRECLLVTQFISLWLFWDDVQVEEHQSWDLDAVVCALAEGRASAGASRYVAAWADLGRRLRETQSDRWLARLASTMREWLANAKVETGLAKALKRDGRSPDFAALFECRTVSIGMYPTFHLIEYAEGIELPDAFHAHPVAIELKRLASRLVGLGNDLGGIAKDIAGRWLNLVLALVEEEGLPIEEAFRRVVEVHNADVAAFDRAAAALPSFGDDDAKVQAWVRAVRHNVHGFTLWESTAQRYQELKAVVDGTALIAPVTYVGGVDDASTRPRRGRPPRATQSATYPACVDRAVDAPAARADSPASAA